MTELLSQISLDGNEQYGKLVKIRNRVDYINSKYQGIHNNANNRMKYNQCKKTPTFPHPEGPITNKLSLNARIVKDIEDINDV